MNLLITGGCGFIGSNFINHILGSELSSKEYNIINIDALYYCADEKNITEQIRNSDNYTFIKGNINDVDLVKHILLHHKINSVIHFAAQSHVQNSFNDSIQFTNDNILGTHNLLECCKKYGKLERFIHVSTDEVYGESMLDVNEQQKTEHSILCPTNPYAATKAGAELIAQSYNHSFGMPIIITRGNNVYGPNQYPEKLIPKFIKQLKEGNKVTIQGDGSCVRAFLHAYDTAKAFQIVLEKGKIGEIYNIGCDEGMEYSVKDVASLLIKKIKGENVCVDKWIDYIEDRPFNDKRYYISNQKLKDLGWNISMDFEDGINQLIFGEFVLNKNLIKYFNNKNNLDIFGKWINNIQSLKDNYIKSKPFNYLIIDDFLDSNFIEKIYDSYPKNYDDWHFYNNPLEVKYANNNIGNMDCNIKNLFYILSSKQIVNLFSDISNIKDLEYDPYLHGAGLHAHPKYGRLNMHLDYEKHQILKNKERRLNIILFLNREWRKEWNGDNQFWDENMKECKVKTYPKFNRALIFQTNDKSWHGLPDKIKCPDSFYRKSLAYYYISPLKNKNSDSKFGNNGSGHRTKAAFIKRPSDKYDSRLEKLYKIRPNRRINKKDMDEIWPEWNSIDF
uniref:GDP-mannose 4,6 dehydratase n=1 Tax=Mimiviridae sp. ChoanoV1 TaxID=2596887 RepID=A0A5B8IHX4_9VIRU|nr:hypothetical protein 1_287 [Mimiviridae sp. ChoanoV1]